MRNLERNDKQTYKQSYRQKHETIVGLNNSNKNISFRIFACGDCKQRFCTSFLLWDPCVQRFCYFWNLCGGETQFSKLVQMTQITPLRNELLIQVNYPIYLMQSQTFVTRTHEIHKIFIHDFADFIKILSGHKAK